MNIIGITGLAGAGKDTTADILVREFGYAKIGLADVMKRCVMEIFDWSPESLWGPSELRDRADDPRYPGLTPRRVLQTLGTEWGRALSEDIWINYALSVAGSIVIYGAAYTPQQGVIWRRAEHVSGAVISDVRFSNEAHAIRAKGGQIWRCVRTDSGLSGDAGAHSSEAGIPDDLVDAQIDNNGTMEALVMQVRGLMVAR